MEQQTPSPAGASRMTQKKLAVWLTFLGCIPFVAGTVLLWIDFQPLFLPAGLRMIVHSYAVVCGSFACGLYWGIHLSRHTSLNLYLAGAATALVLWLSLAMAGSVAGIVVCMLAFLFLWLLDFRIYSHKAMPAWFFGLRTLAYAVALACLLAIVLF